MSGVAKFYDSSGSLVFQEKIENGVLSIGSEIELICVESDNGFCNYTIDLGEIRRVSIKNKKPFTGGVFYLKRHKFKRKPWWQRDFGLRRRNLTRKLSKPTVGIIDEFNDAKLMRSSVEFYDPLNLLRSDLNRYKSYREDYHRRVSHGQQLVQMLCGHSRGGFLGPLHHSELVAMEARAGSLAGLEIDSNKPSISRVAMCVKALAELNSLNIINLSLGFTDGTKIGLEQQIENAYRNGVVCFCANGEPCDQGLGLVFPASIPYTVAVSGVGQFGVAATGTDLFLQEGDAIASGVARMFKSRNGEKYFFQHDYKRGIVHNNVFAPSLALPLPYPEGQVVEVSGTSFATAVFAAAVALRLRDDKTVQKLSGLDKSKYIVAISLDVFEQWFVESSF